MVLKMNGIFIKLPLLTFILAVALLCGCAHPNAALGEFRGKYVRAGFKTNGTSLQTEIVLTSRGEVFVKPLGSTELKKDNQLNKLKTKAVMLAVEKSGILSDHKNTTGAFSTFYVEYHKRNKSYQWTWGELNWPDEINDVYKDLLDIRKTE